MSAGISVDELLKIIAQHQASSENVENLQVNTPSKSPRAAVKNLEGTRARADVQESRTPSCYTYLHRQTHRYS